MNTNATKKLSGKSTSGRFQGIGSYWLKATGHMLAFILIAGLVIAWVFSEPIFKLHDHFTVSAKQKRNRHISAAGRIGRIAVLMIIWIATTISSGLLQAQSQLTPIDSIPIAPPISKPTTESIWQNGIGEGFKDGDQSISLSFGGADGVRIFGGRDRHDLELNSLSYGYMLGAVEGDGHWYRGNWELRGELFGGVQFSPSGNWVVGLTPHLRYNFATGTRWIPFLDLGAGISATGIGAPDLSGTFEFNLQANTGVRWFIRDNLALTFEAGYLHLSDAGISRPNQGANALKGMMGVSWFF